MPSIAESFRKNPLNNLRTYLGQLAEKRRKEQAREQVKQALAGATTRKAEGTTTFTPESVNQPFKPMQFDETVDMGQLLTSIEPDNPYREQTLTDQERLARFRAARKPRSKYETAGGGIQRITESPEGEFLGMEELLARIERPKPGQRITRDKTTRDVDGEPRIIERTFIDGQLEKEEDIGKAFVKPDKPAATPDPSELSDVDREVGKLEREILQLESQQTLLSAGFYKDPETGDIVEADSEKAKTLMEELKRQQAIKTSQIAGLQNRRRESQQEPPDRADAGTKRPTISLKEARATYGDQAKNWKDSQLKAFLEGQGFRVTTP